MNRNRLLILGLIGFVLLWSSNLAIAQNLSIPEFPDYTKWEKVDLVNTGAVLDGKNINLPVERYQFTDLPNLKRYAVNVVLDDRNNLRLAMYFYQIWERKTDGSVVLKENYVHIFENIEGKWVFIKDFSQSKDFDKESNDFLKERYKLIFLK